jgi:hypothetical protein
MNAPAVARVTPLLPALFSLLVAALPAGGAPQVNGIHLPPGFSISVYAANIPGARSMTLGAEGTLFIGTRDQGAVYAIPNAEIGRAHV